MFKVAIFWTIVTLYSNYHIFTKWNTSTILTFIILNIIGGIFIVEYCWKRMKRAREVEEERDSLFPAFRRTDTNDWKKWSFYPVACTSIVIRAALSLSLLATAGFVSFVLRIGID